MRATAFIVFCVSTVGAFVLPAARPTILQAPGKALSLTRQPVPVALALQATKLPEGDGYWEGDWVCADCGYIYDAEDCNNVKFEDQPRGFLCPQCRGPRRRFAKKVGDKVGVTLDGGDGPILFFSFAGLAITVAFGFWFAGQ